MKMTGIIGLLIAGFCGGAFAGVQTCQDRATGHKLVILFPAGGGMGISRGTAKLSRYGTQIATLGCSYSSGITTTLSCGNREGYLASAVTNLEVLPLSYRGNKVATLICN
jgi:hypothetical protein